MRRVHTSSFDGHGLQLYQPAVNEDIKLKAFIIRSKLKADWKQALLRALRDKQPVDAQVGDWQLLVGPAAHQPRLLPAHSTHRGCW